MRGTVPDVSLMLWVFVASVLQQSPLVTEQKCDGFSVVFTSPSGTPTEDDERVEVVAGSSRFTVPFKPAMFTGLGAAPAPNKQLKCRDGLIAYEVRPQVMLLAVSRSGRPGLDLISFALIDLKRGKTLSVLETNFEVASGRVERPMGTSFSLVSRGAKGGFDLRLVRESLPEDDGPTGAIEDWLAVRVEKDVVRANWLRK